MNRKSAVSVGTKLRAETAERMIVPDRSFLKEEKPSSTDSYPQSSDVRVIPVQPVSFGLIVPMGYNEVISPL